MNKELCYNFGNIFISIDTVKNDEPCVVLGEKIAEPPANVRIVFSSHNECVVDIFIKLINKINTLEAENEMLKKSAKFTRKQVCEEIKSKLFKDCKKYWHYHYFLQKHVEKVLKDIEKGDENGK